MKKLFTITIVVMGLWLGAFSANATSTRNHFFQTHGFVFFFASTCPYCHQFSPVLSQVSKQLGASVLPLSFDNQPLPEFQKVLPATSDWTTVAFKNASIHYPALFIANPKTQELYPVSIGALNEMELTTRIEALIPKIMIYENTEVTA